MSIQYRRVGEGVRKVEWCCGGKAEQTRVELLVMKMEVVRGLRKNRVHCCGVLGERAWREELGQRYFSVVCKF